MAWKEQTTNITLRECLRDFQGETALSVAMDDVPSSSCALEATMEL